MDWLIALCVLSASIKIAHAACPVVGNNAFVAKSPNGSSPWPTSAFERATPHATNQNDKLVQLNDAFINEYDESGDLVRPLPLLIVENDYLVEWRNGSRVVLGTYTPDEYHDFKMISHVPLAIVTICLPAATTSAKSLDHETKVRLRAYLTKLEDVIKGDVLSRFDRFPSEIRQGQLNILEKSRSLAQSLLSEAQPVNIDTLQKFAKSLLSDINSNLDTAAAAQVNALHSMFAAYRASLDDVEKDKLRIGVITSTMARRNNLVGQYFSRYYNVDIELNERFFTFEQVEDEPTAFKIVSTHVTDKLASRIFFGDPFRLQRDALADGAKKRLDEMFGPSRMDSWSEQLGFRVSRMNGMASPLLGLIVTLSGSVALNIGLCCLVVRRQAAASSVRSTPSGVTGISFAES